MADIVIYTDGAARGNPGESASGYIVYENGKIVKKHSEYNGKTTNNRAEYIAVVKALEWCLDNIKNCINKNAALYSDSELVVRQINGVYKIKSPNVKELNKRVRDLANGFKNIGFNNLPREENHIRMVDKELNRLLDYIEEK